MIEILKKILIASVTEIQKLPKRSFASCLTSGSIRILMFAVFVMTIHLLFLLVYSESYTNAGRDVAILGKEGREQFL